MKKSTLVKLAMTLTLALLVSGAFAQTTIAVRLNAGAIPAAGTATLYTISAVGVETTTGFSNDAAGDIITGATLTANTLYSIIHSGGTRITFRTPAVVVNFSARLHSAIIDANYSQAKTTNYQTKGKSFRLYVAPDPIYSPSYDNATVATLNPASSWTWTYATLTGAPATTVPLLQQNYLDITGGFAAAGGPYNVNVVETGPLGCVTGTGVNQEVYIVESPNASINGTVANGTWTPTANATTLTKTACVSTITGTETVTVSITEDANLPLEFKSYALLVREVIDNVQVDLVTQDGATILNTPWDYTVASKLKTGNLAIPGTHTWTPVNGLTSTYALPTAALTVRNAKPTRYTYSVASASDATGVGVLSAISQKSDYLTNGGPAGPYTFYGLGGIVNIIYIVLPAPTTGPIYHISNSFAY